MAREENVVMVHDKIKGKAVATVSAYEKVWKGKGWKKAPKETASSSTSPST